VTAPEQWNLLDPLVLAASIRYDETLKTLDALVDVRVGLESQMTRRAAQVMSDEQLSDLHAALIGTRAACWARSTRTCLLTRSTTT
jgi:DNA-binding FadR family transcriptional regulator